MPYSDELEADEPLDGRRDITDPIVLLVLRWDIGIKQIP